MAMPVTLTVWATDQATAESACRKAFAKIDQLVKVYSDYDREAEVYRLNRLQVGESMEVSAELASMIRFCQQLHHRSNHVFDPTAGELIELWRVARRTVELPTDDAIRIAIQHSGFDSLELQTVSNDNSATPQNNDWNPKFPTFDGGLADINPAQPVLITRRSNSKLDFGSIAKGRIGDVVIALLKHEGVPIACYEAGGDIVCGAAPPNEKGWLVELPDQTTTELANAAIAISGDTEQAVVIEEIRYSHVIDIRTGQGVATRRMAYVIAPQGVISDPLATIGCIVEPEEFTKTLQAFKGVTGDSFVVD
ncbi:MAG: FAD:protein FMN transferase [Planctomycetota bacterium]